MKFQLKFTPAAPAATTTTAAPAAPTATTGADTTPPHPLILQRAQVN